MMPSTSKTAAALGATALLGGAAFGLEVGQGGGTGWAAFERPPARAADGAGAQNAPSEIFQTTRAGFDDVAVMEFDVASAVRAISGRVSAEDPARSAGRVAVRIADDRASEGAPNAADPQDAYVRAVEQTGGRNPVSVYDVGSGVDPVSLRGGVQLAYAAPFSGRIGDDFQLAVEPRANVVLGRDVSGVGYGAVVRFGRNLASPRKERPRWYAFIGADAQALTWSLEPGLNGEQELRLEQRTLIGDAQAGVAVRLGAGDLAVGYVHREVRYEQRMSEEEISRVERFVGVSYTITR